MRVRVTAPATVANVGPGFDVFGIALSGPFDTIVAEDADDVAMGDVSGPGSDRIPRDPSRNSATIAASRVLETVGHDAGVRISIEKGIRPGSGIGSSGASAAGGAFAANELLGRPLDEAALVACAAEAEGVTAGKAHADNVAPAIMGGFTVVRSVGPVDIVRITPPEWLGIAVVMPDVVVPTRESRGVLPSTVDVTDLVHHVAHACTLALGMERGDRELISKGVSDAVFEPARAHLVPGLDEAERAAMDAGAMASFMGGSGPCVIAFFDDDGENVASAMKEAFTERGIGSESWVTGWGDGCERI